MATITRFHGVDLSVPQLYGIGLAGSLLLLLIVRALRSLSSFSKRYGIPIKNYLVYPRILPRYRFFGPWTYVQVAVQLLYFSINLFCAWYVEAGTSSEAAQAGHLSLMNMVPVYLGLHMGFASDLLGISISKYYTLHASAGCMTILLSLLHVLICVFSKPSLTDDRIFGLTAVICMASMLLISPIFRWLSYEIFLRIHQGLAIMVVYALWKHVSQWELPRIYLLICGGTFLVTVALEVLTLLYRNVSIHGETPRALIARHNGAVRVTIYVPKDWGFKAGQYVNLWMPSISPLSALQTHPFTIASWSGGERPSIDLLIEPRTGFTQRLFTRADAYREDRHSGDKKFRPIQRAFGDARVSDTSEPTRSHIALLSGPHGLPVRAGDYGRVFMIATGFGITAQLPLLKELIQGFNASVVRTRYITLVWQLQHHGDEKPASDLLDRALEEDELGNGYMLRIRIYYEQGRLSPTPQYGGVHGRLAYDNGKMKLSALVDDEILLHGVYSQTKMLITVSANTQVRDELRLLLQPHLSENVRLLELDYQPAENKQLVWT
ncbi:hypothetical protein F5884DRAFT_534680 [Xylogone sp. PMI_703]|nr:hypothetical protein F5884DRAFT_534680 [Xylogone sp. PMI_703]